MLPIEDSEWQAAERLKPQTDAKQAHTLSRNGPVRVGYQPESKCYRTRHSFLHVQSDIFAIEKDERKVSHPLMQGGATAGRGNYGRVKRITNQRGEKAVVKISRACKDSRIEASRAKKRLREFLTLQDLGMTRHGMFSRTNKKGENKQYMIMSDLGRPLDKVLPEGCASLTDTQRLDMAIGISLAVVDLHYFARQSRSRTRYAHGDIKPDNVTIDAFGKLHLVDHGTSKTKPESLLLASRGAYLYAPPPQVLFEKWKHDVLALKRLLLYPQQVRNFRDIQAPPTYSHYYSILTPELVQACNLGAFIDTSKSCRNSIESFMQDKTTSLSLAAILIMARIDRKFSYKLLLDNSYLCLLIVDWYQNQVPLETIKTQVAEAIKEAKNPSPAPECVKQRALQINRIRNLQMTEDAIQSSTELARLLDKLEHLGLTHHIHQIASHEALSHRLLSVNDNPEFYQHLNWMLEDIPNDPTHLKRHIDAYLNQDPLLAIMIRRQVTRAFYTSELDDKQGEFLTWCDTLDWTTTAFHHVVPRVILNPEALKAMIAVREIRPDICKKWMHRIEPDLNPEHSDIYIKVACLLKERVTAPKIFKTVFDALEESVKTLDVQKSILILLENNLPIQHTNFTGAHKERYAKLIVHLSRLGLQAHLPEALNFSSPVVEILNTIAASDFQGSLGAILNDPSLLERLAMDKELNAMKLIECAEFLNQNQQPFTSLSNKQVSSLIMLMQCKWIGSDKMARSIAEIMCTTNAPQTDNPLAGLLNHFQASITQAACSSSEPEPDNCAGPSMC